MTENESLPESQELAVEERPPSELESALLTIAMFGGLIIFTIGCTMLGWFD
jgi:hypothetical protein